MKTLLDFGPNRQNQSGALKLHWATKIDLHGVRAPPFSETT